jgi:hypothetical protein
MTSSILPVSRLGGVEPFALAASGIWKAEPGKLGYRIPRRRHQILDRAVKQRGVCLIDGRGLLILEARAGFIEEGRLRSTNAQKC